MKTMNICKTRHAELVSASIKTRFRNKFGITLIIFLLLSVCSCSNLFEDKLEKHSEEQQASDITSSKPAYLVISPNDVSINSRSVYPNLEDTLSKLRDITLYGKKTSNPDGTAVSESSSSLASAGSLAALYNKQILLEKGAGFYTFELKGTIDSVYFYQKLENVEIEDAKTNTISFALQPIANSSDVTTPFDDYGGMHIKLYYSNSVNATYTVKLTVENLTTGEPVVTDQALSPEQTSGVYSATNRYVEYKRWASFGTSSSAPRIATGEYRVTFKFYFGEQLLNSLPYVVHVAKGINTVYEDTIDLNEIYKITYNYNQGSTSVKLASGQTLVEKYSRKSDDIILPRYYKMASLFLGWYTANEGGELVTHIPKGSTGNITLYAHWLSLENNTPQTLYINPDAQYHYGFSEEYGLESIAAAIETLKENSQSSSKHDWTIKIKGSLSGANTIESTSAGNPSYWFRSYVTSLTLEGASNLSNGVPQDEFNGGFTGYDNGNDNYGTTLTIDTTVPVTIKNLKITGGYASNNYGAGLSVIGNSKVYLEEGTLISGNTSDAAAAAIGVNDAATVTMNGGSIENNTSLYEYESGNYSGTVLIYKDSSSEASGNPKFILNGGTIKKNKTQFYGGGVGVLSNGKFEMNGGTIGGSSDEDANIADISDAAAYSSGSSTYGGGVFVGSDGFFTMKGGVISHNKALGIGLEDLVNHGQHNNCGGAGVAVCDGGSFEMQAGTLNGVPTAGEISSNTSGRNGGGVYLDSTSTFTMKAGTISGNTSTDEGKGVYLSNSGCTFKMGKAAVVNENNDVYLPDGTSITISEDFDGNITTAAVITPQTYSTQTAVLTAEGVNLEKRSFCFRCNTTGNRPGAK